MPGVQIGYDPRIVAASVVIAIVAATAALLARLPHRAHLATAGSGGVMGVAIAGMHYTGMAAARFTHGRAMASSPTAHVAIQPGMLAVAVVSATSILLLLGLVTAFFDRKLATLTAHEAAALRQSEERLPRAASRTPRTSSRSSIGTAPSSTKARAPEHVLGYDTAELLGRQLIGFRPAGADGGCRGFLQHAARTDPRASRSSSCRSCHPDGTWRDFEVVGKNLLAEPTIGGIVVNMRDITERKRLMAQLEKLSETDLLTGTFNRRGFMKRAAREFERTRRRRAKR